MKLDYIRLPSVPTRYSSCRFDNFNPRTVKQRVALDSLRKADSDCHVLEGHPVILLGPPGTGKTHLGTAMLYASAAGEEPDDREALADYHFAAYSDLAAGWRAARVPVLDPVLFKSMVLLLDDLDQPRTPNETDMLAELIDRRYQSGNVRLIVTSNLTVPELRQALGDRAFDRLREGALLRPLDGVSYRARHGWEGAPIDDEGTGT